MPLKKLIFKSGVNRENTRYYTEGGWYDCDKIRFRQASPQKIGGWVRTSNAVYRGICRSLWAWETLANVSLVGIGTNLKFYISRYSLNYDITPIRIGVDLTNPFTATTGETTVLVDHVAHGCVDGDFVTYNGATGLGGNITANILNREYQITLINVDSYTINVGVVANSLNINHGNAVRAVYQINTGPAVQVPFAGWGAGGWGYGSWGIGQTGVEAIRLWSQSNYGQDLVFGRRGGGIYYSYANRGVSPSAVSITVATPAVFTASDHYEEGAPIYLETSGALPTGLLTGQLYYVRNYEAGVFNVSATPNGLLVNTSATGTGTNYISARAVPLDTIPGATTYTSVTITIAAPAVVTLSTLSMYAENMPIYFDTSGALPTGLSVGTTYYIKNYNADTKTFNVSLTVGGTAVTTTGTQSGTQYVYPALLDTPIIQNYITISDTYRFVFAFGCNDYGSTTQDPLLVRWSAQESAADWTPAVTNQAGSLRLTRGSQIITVMQTRQEIVVWTDSTLYSMQYLGYPLVWSAQLLGDNISIVSENAAALASGVVYWMGRDKFYKYDGRVQTLNCDLREYIFGDFNTQQNLQVYAGTNEGFNEVWWFYCSAGSTVMDKYVIYNYAEDIWYYGTMGRTAWLDSGILDYPLGATYSNNLVNHELGVDDYESDTPQPINAYITSSETDIDDGHQFVFIRRVLPDLTFRGSSTKYPQATLSIKPLVNSGSGYTDPASVGGSDINASAAVARSATVPIEQYTGQVFIRVRGRQFSFKIESNQLGCTWQLGAIRIDMKVDGQRGNSGS